MRQMMHTSRLPTNAPWGIEALWREREARRAQQDSIADLRDHWIRRSGCFYDRIRRLMHLIIGPGKRALGVSTCRPRLADCWDLQS